MALAFDFVVVLGSVFFGVGCAIFINRFSKTKKENKIRASEDIKSEFNNLVFERDVALEALGKVNQFFGEKKIDSFEKDRLLLKYGKLLERYDERIFQLQPSLEIRDMYEYRNQLYSFMSNSVDALDKKLDSLGDKFGCFKWGNNGDKAYSDPAPPALQKAKSPDRKSDKTATATASNNNNGSMSSLVSKSRPNGFELSGHAEAHQIISPISEGNDDDAAAIGPNTKRDDLSLNAEDIDKIQQDILKILKRLENPSS